HAGSIAGPAASFAEDHRFHHTRYSGSPAVRRSNHHSARWQGRADWHTYRDSRPAGERIRGTVRRPSAGLIYVGFHSFVHCAIRVIQYSIHRVASYPYVTLAPRITRPKAK